MRGCDGLGPAAKPLFVVVVDPLPAFQRNAIRLPKVFGYVGWLLLELDSGVDVRIIRLISTSASMSSSSAT